MDKVVIKILQGSTVTSHQSVLGGLTIYPLVISCNLQVSYSVDVSKIMRVGWQ